MRIEAREFRVAAVGLFAAAMLPLLATPVLPLIDLYNHVARFFVLSHLGSSSVLPTYYESHWSLLPDMGVDVLATPLLTFVPPLIAAHLIVVFIMAVIFGGVLYFRRMVTGQRSLLVAAMLLPLLYSYILNWGFANFLLGLGFAFWGAGWWFSHRDRPWLAVPVSCVISILIFLTHGLAFGLYGVMVAALEVGLFVRAPTHRPLDLVRALCLTAIQAIIPLLFLLFWMGGTKPPTEALQSVSLESMGYPPGFAGRALKRLVPILRVEEGPSYAFDIATFLIQAAAVFFLFWRRQIRIAPMCWPLLIAAALTVGVGVPQLFGVSYITDRMPLFAGLALLGVLSFRAEPWPLASRIAGAVLVGVVVVRLAAVAMSWHAYGAQYREFQSVAAHIPPGSLTIGVGIGSGFHETNVPRCEMYGPLLVSQYGQAGPLFADAKQQPLGLVGRLKDAVATLHANQPLERPSDYARFMSDAASAGFDYMLVCNAHLLTQPYPDNAALVAQTAHFALLRAKR